MSNLDSKKLLNNIKFLAKKRKYNDAARRMNEYLELNPNDYYSKVYHAMLLNKLGNYDEAKEILNRLLKEDYLLDQKTLLFAYSQYARIMANTKNYEESIRFYNLVINNSYEDELEARFELSRLYFSLDKMNECFNILTLPDKESRFLSMKKASLLMKKHKYKQALHEIKKNKDRPWDKGYGFDESFLKQEEFFLIGDCYMHLKDNVKALDYLNKACTNKNSRNYYKAYFDIAYIKNRENKHNEAILILKNLLSSNNVTFMKNKIHSELFKAYLKKGDIANAEKHILEVDDSYGQQSYLFSKLECSKGNFNKADEYMNKAKEKNIEMFPELYLYSVIIKFRLEKYNEALQYISQLDDTYIENSYSYNLSQLKYELHLLKIIINKKLNNDIVLNKSSYMEEQIVNFSVDKTINYIYDNHFDKNKITLYKEDINIENIINDVKNKLDEKLKFTDDIFDKYIISYPNIGIDYEGNNVNQLIVITLPDTKNIVGMYPFNAEDNINYTKSTELQNSNIKTYRMSQIDKFKARYGDKYQG